MLPSPIFPSPITEQFYESLPSLEKFIDLANPQHYVDVPEDWYAVITDVVGSTAAIAAGRYKDVNFLGACSIIAVLNALHPLDIPFVFGGDGASILVPPAALEPTKQALIGLRYLAHHSFAMDLRVGVVPVSLIRQRHVLKVAKAQLTPRYVQASFLGGGMTYATDLIKQDGRYCFEALDAGAGVDLTGMECRWQEVSSSHGQTLSLIVAALPEAEQSEAQIYREVLETIQQIYGGEQTYHPVAETALQLSFNPEKLSTEVKARAGSNHVWARLGYLGKVLVQNALGWLLMRLQIKFSGVNWGQYRQSVALAADYQKIDDVLRMVIAGRPEQTEQLQAYLTRRLKSGDLLYGVHVSDRALLTCLIFDRRDRHIHLVDAADGGYALAAKQIKRQLAERAKQQAERQNTAKPLGRRQASERG
jgi:hypothetical protein